MKRTLVSFDWALKGILREKANFVVLSGLLTELLGKKVTVYDILESESNVDNVDGKSNKLDLKAKIDDDELAIFEVQVNRQGDFFHRILYGTSNAVVEQLHKGDKFGKIRKVYSVDIVYFDLGKGSDYIYHGTTSFKGLHNRETLLLSDKEMKFLPHSVHGEQSVGALFPEYYLIYPNWFNGKIKNRIDEWVYALKTSTVESTFTAAGIQELGEALDERKMTESERIAHEDHIKYTRVKDSEIETAWEDGLIEGKVRGMAKVFELLEKGVSLDEAKKQLGIG